MLCLLHPSLMDLIRLSHIKINQVAVWGILYPWYPVCQFFLPATLFVDKPHELDTFDVVMFPSDFVWQALCTFIINTAGFNAEKHILRAEAKSEVLRIAHGHQSRFKDIDSAAFSVERYAWRRVIPNDILFQFVPSVERA